MFKRILILVAFLLTLPFVHQSSATEADIYCQNGSPPPQFTPCNSNTPLAVTVSGGSGVPVTANQGTPNAGGATNSWFIQGAGVAGTPAGGVASVQGVAGGTALPVSGNIGGYDFFVSTTPTIQNAQYVSGNCMGGFQAVTVATTTGASGILTNFTLISKGALVTAKQIYIFSSNPSGSTCTDKSTFTIAAADLPKLITSISVTPAVPTGGAASVGNATNLVQNFVTSGNGNLYFAIVETATETPATTSDLIFNAGGIKDAP